MTPGEIAALLARDAEGIARMLLPNGKREGAEWRVGSVQGEAGKSLGVHLAGERAGVWWDFAAGEAGDLLDLWAAVRNLSLRDTIDQAKAHLGIAEPRFQGHQPKRFRRPERPHCQATRPESLVGLYLGEERGLSTTTLGAYKIAERGRDIVLPSLRNGELVTVKYLGVDRPGGKKQIRVEADCEPGLFGWQAIPDNARSVAITEGEIDAMSLHQLGVPALSVPFGGGKGDKQCWIEYEYPHLEQFDTIYLCLDADQPGREASELIAERLGQHRCRLVDFPPRIKDANEFLTSGATVKETKALFERARTLDPEELRQAAEYADEVIDLFYPPEGDQTGFIAPWKNFQAFAFRPGEVVVLAGVNGHGKSEVAGHLTLGGAATGLAGLHCLNGVSSRPVTATAHPASRGASRPV